MGTRLRPITNKTPKCLIPVDGRPILQWQLENLKAQGIDEIVLVLGYKQAMVKRFLARKGVPRVKVIVNEDFATTNNIYSLFLARKELAGKAFLLLNGDVYCDPAIYSDILSDRRSSLVPYDSNFFDPEELKLLIRDGRAVQILPKRTGRGKCDGSTIGIFKIGAPASRVLFDELDRMMCLEAERRQWFEHVLNTVFGKVRFFPLDIVGYKWVEIDTKDDIKKAVGFAFQRGK